MPLSSNGITPEVIRGIMPPYTLSTDLLEGTFRALPAPRPNATTAWRYARIARLVQEIGGLMPADAPQARIAAQILIIREAACDTVAQSYAPGLTVEQLCRLRRTAADLTRSTATLERMLERRQAKPAPFFGTVEADAVDIGALDAVWCRGAAATAGAAVAQQGAAPTPVTPPDNPGPGINPEGPGPDGEAAPNHASPRVRLRRARSAAPAAQLAPDAGAPPTWTTTRLDQGPGWTLDVVRPRRDGEAGGGAVPTES